jgi:enoyl-CoA hydratase/carnithine racemase
MPVLYEKRGHVGIVTLSRPEVRNAWGEEYYEGLERYFGEMEADRDVHCAILTGDEKGRAFSAGADLKNKHTHSTESAAAFIEEFPKRRRRFPANLLSEFPKPVVAAVNGYAIGIGCIVTYCCDLIVASERAEWRLTQASLGIMPAYGGTPRLARWIGKGQATRLAMGFPIKADEAYRMGLAQWLVPHEQIMEKALEVANHIASHPPLATRITKESIERGLDIPNIKDASLVDLYRFMALEMTEDKEEAHTAWREKRKPVFKGK